MAPRSPVTLVLAMAWQPRIMLKLPTQFTVMVLLNKARNARRSCPNGFSGNACAADQAHQFAQRYCFVDHRLCIGFIVDIAAHKAPPISLVTASAFSTCMSAMTTVPPRKASMRAVPSPSPRRRRTMNTLPLIS